MSSVARLWAGSYCWIMRCLLVTVAALAMVPTATAEPTPGLKPGLIWQDRVITATSDSRAFAAVSHKLYLNPCLPDGCTVRPGKDDARNNASSIPEAVTTLTG